METENKQIVISVRGKGRKPEVELEVVDVPSGEFGDAADACRDYCLARNLNPSKIKWAWVGSAWERSK